MSTKIRFACSRCERALNVDIEKAGKKLRCPDCQTVLTVPAESVVLAPKAEGRVKRDAAQSQASGSKSTLESSAAPKKAGRRSEQDNADDHLKPVRRKRTAATDDAQDIWSQPLSSYASPALEEHEYEQFGIQPKRPRMREDEHSSDSMTLKGPVIFFVVGILVGLVSIGLAFAHPASGRVVSFVAIGLGALLSLIGHWKIRETAFQESTSCGFMYVWVPFYQPYYIISRFATIKIPFVVSLLGNIILFLGFLGMIFADIQLEKSSGA